jgi:serine/threonine protein kinase
MFEAFKGLFGKKRTSDRPRAAVNPPARPAARPKLKRTNIARRFQILSETSQGSMSKVFKAIDQDNGRTVCLKVQDRAKTTAAMARTGATAELRPTEGEIGSKIIHPHVVRTVEYGESNKREYYVVMEYIDGVSLTFVRESRGLKLAEKIDLLAQSAEALAAVHAAGYIHHDFGPKNLLVDRNDQIKLIDFGLAIPNTPEFRKPGNRTGTLNYLAPEVIRREPKDERLDIFAWGVTAFEFFTGRQPYDYTPDSLSQMRLRINSDPYELSKIAPHLPPALCEIVDRTLTRRKEDRWPKANTLADALREVPLNGR